MRHLSDVADEDKCSVKVGKVYDAPIRVSYLMVIAYIFQLLPLFSIYSKRIFSNKTDPLDWFAFQFTYATVLFLCASCGTILVHELGHGLMSRFYNGTIVKIFLWPLGGLCYSTRDWWSCTDKRKRLWEELMIATAGPLTHIPMAIIWFSVVLLLHFSTLSTMNSTVIAIGGGSSHHDTIDVTGGLFGPEGITAMAIFDLFFRPSKVGLSFAAGYYRFCFGVGAGGESLAEETGTGGNTNFLAWFVVLMWCLSKSMIMVNTVLFLFNFLVPLYPMDSSKILIFSSQYFFHLQESKSYWLFMISSITAGLGIIFYILLNPLVSTFTNGLVAFEASTTSILACFIVFSGLKETYRVYQLKEAGFLRSHQLFQFCEDDLQSNENKDSDSLGHFQGAYGSERASYNYGTTNRVFHGQGHRLGNA